jgi:hypothetical protein
MQERKVSHEELEQSYEELKKIVYNLKPDDLVEILRKNHALLLFQPSDDNTSSLWEMLLYSKRSDLFLAASHLAIELIRNKDLEKHQFLQFEYNRRGILSLAAVLGNDEVFNFCADYFCGSNVDPKLTCQNYSMSLYSSSMPDDTADYLFSHGAEGYSHSKMFERVVSSMLTYYSQGSADIRLH